MREVHIHLCGVLPVPVHARQDLVLGCPNQVHGTVTLVPDILTPTEDRRANWADCLPCWAPSVSGQATPTSTDCGPPPNRSRESSKKKLARNGHRLWPWSPRNHHSASLVLTTPRARGPLHGLLLVLGRR